MVRGYRLSRNCVHKVKQKVWPGGWRSGDSDVGKKAFCGLGDNWKEVHVERLASEDKAGIMYPRFPGTPQSWNLGVTILGWISGRLI